MSTVVLIILIVLCAGVVLAIVGHLGLGIADDQRFRARMRRRRAARTAGRNRRG